MNELWSSSLWWRDPTQGIHPFVRSQKRKRQIYDTHAIKTHTKIASRRPREAMPLLQNNAMIHQRGFGFPSPLEIRIFIQTAFVFGLSKILCNCVLCSLFYFTICFTLRNVCHFHRKIFDPIKILDTFYIFDGTTKNAKMFSNDQMHCY